MTGQKYGLEKVREFIRTQCVLGPEHRIGTSKLYDAYKNWAQKEGHVYIVSHTFFSMRLKDEGFLYSRNATERFFEGIWCQQ